MEKVDIELAMEIISMSGQVKYSATMAIKSAKKGDFISAQNHLTELDDKYLLLNEINSDLIKNEIAADLPNTNLLMIHAQTHIAMALQTKEMAEELFSLYETVNKLQLEVSLLKNTTKSGIKVLIICVEGISTSLFVNHMKQYASKQDIIEAASIHHLHSKVKFFDVILIAPHLIHKDDIIRKICIIQKKPFDIISHENYGRFNGKAVMEQALRLFTDYCEVK